MLFITENKEGGSVRRIRCIQKKGMMQAYANPP